jgi:nucleoid-associated protein YgaU
MIDEYCYRGRHRKPSTAGRTVIRSVAVGAAAVALPVAIPPSAYADPPGGWGPIIRCESSGKNVDRLAIDGASTASGYFQFVNGTWELFGGTEFGPRAKDASFAEQKIVANRAFAANGLRDWEESRDCWRPLLGKVSEPTPRKAERAERRAERADRPGLDVSALVGDVRVRVRVADPGGGGGRHRAAEGAVYTVREGDTLGRIAHRDGPGGVTVASLVRANASVQDDPDAIEIGQRLRLT